jgi:hydrogenase expression/formation protein HypC
MCLAIPGRIVGTVDAEQGRAVIEVDGVRREISVALLVLEGGEAVAPGDWVLVHVGFAMARIDEREAAETLTALRRLGSAYDDEVRDLGAGEPP